MKRIPVYYGNAVVTIDGVNVPVASLSVRDEASFGSSTLDAFVRELLRFPGRPTPDALLGPASGAVASPFLLRIAELTELRNRAYVACRVLGLDPNAWLAAAERHARHRARTAHWTADGGVRSVTFAEALRAEIDVLWHEDLRTVPWWMVTLVRQGEPMAALIRAYRAVQREEAAYRRAWRLRVLDDLYDLDAVATRQRLDRAAISAWLSATWGERLPLP